VQQEQLSILLVDDEETFVRLLAEQLRDDYGYTVSYVTSGREAIERIQNARRGYDVVLLDYMMPEMTGLNVLQWLHEQKNETPVVVLTAAGSEPVAVEAMKLGAYDYLRKEHLDIQRLGLVIQSTHERHMFRVVKALEEERWREIGLNKEATDRVQDVLSAITPKLNDTFAQIAAILETDGERLVQGLPPDSRKDVRELFAEIHRQLGWLETGVKGLLSLYRILYARYTEAHEIDTIRQEFEKSSKAGR
jgi:DNA-binding NtrC family response regulator